MSGLFRDQSTIYEKFRQNKTAVSSLGIAPDPVVPRRVGAVNVVFRFADEPMAKLEQFSTNIASCVPSLTYGKANAHATVGVVRQRDNFVQTEDDHRAIRQINTALAPHRNEISNRLNLCEFTLNEYLYNQTTVMCAGIANRAAADLMEIVLGACALQGIEMSRPWGAHITTSRFTDSLMSTEKISELIAILESAPSLGICTPVAMEVGYCTTDESSFNLFTVHRFL